MAQLRNLPANVVRQHVLQRMNARTAARFAVASRDHSANALGRARHMVDQPRGAMQSRIDVAARQLAGMFLLALKYVQRGRWRNQTYGHIGVGRQVYRNVQWLGRTGLYIQPNRLRLSHWGSTSFTAANIEVHKVGQQYKLRTPVISFIALTDLRLDGQSAPLPTSRKWFLRSAIIRAVQMYNDRPLSDM